MSSSKPKSVRKFLMNVPPPSNEVKDDKILEELSRLQTQKLITKHAQEPKLTIAQIIRSNSLKESKKRKSSDITTGPLSEIDPKSDRLVASVKKFKKPSCVKKPLLPIAATSSAAQLSPINTELPSTSTSSCNPSSASNNVSAINLTSDQPVTAVKKPTSTSSASSSSSSSSTALLLESSTSKKSRLPEISTPRRHSDPTSNIMSNTDIKSGQTVSSARRFKKPSCVNVYSPYRRSTAGSKSPKPSTPRRNSDPISNNVPVIDVTVQSIGKFKRPPCVETSLPLSTPSSFAKQSPTSPANSTNSPAPGHNSDPVSNDVAEKPKVKVIDDILESIFQSAKNPVKVNDASPKSISPSHIASVSASTSANAFANTSPKLIASPRIAAPSFACSSSLTGSSASLLAPHHMKSPPSSSANIKRSLDIKDSPVPSVPARVSPTIPPWSVVEQQSSVDSQPSSTADSGVSLSPAKTSQLPSSPHLSQQSNSSMPSAHLPNDSSNSKKQKKKQKKKNRQQKKNEARAASKRHKDFPTNIEDADFDTLLQYHEKATSSKQADKSSNKQNDSSSNNNQPLNYHQNGSTSKQDNDYLKKNNNQSSNAASMNASTSGKRSIEDIAREITGAPKPVKRSNDSNQKQQNKRQKTKKEFVPLITCRFFANGYCSGGDSCTFKHDQANVVAKPDLKKNIVCEFFKTGSCYKGDDCTFSHDLQLEPCKFFHLNSKCRHNDCPYSHAPLNEDMLMKLRKLTGPCIFYNFKGICNVGDACLFSHHELNEEEKSKLESVIRPCTYFHLEGNCAKGQDCFFLHEEATPQQIAELKKNSKDKKKTNVNN